MKLIKIAMFAAAALAVATGPASALADHCPKSSFALSISSGIGGGATPTLVTLTCDRDAGTHPDPMGACALLRGVDGDPALVKGTEGPCTKEYNPHTVVAKGAWRGKAVSFEQTYSNRCMMQRAKGTLFTF